MSTSFSSSLQSAALPQSSTIEWKGATNGAAANPFSRTLLAGDRANKESMMSAFSGMNLALNAKGEMVVSSSSRELLHTKQSEKENEKMAHQEVSKSQVTHRAVTALSQALGDFQTEVERSGRFISNNTRRQKGNDLSRRLRAKKNKMREKAESYDERKSLKTRRDAKRQQRKERYKHVY